MTRSGFPSAGIEEMRALRTLGRIVTAGLSLDEVIQAALDGVDTVLAPDLVRFFTRDGDALILRDWNAGSSELSADKDSGYRVGECLCGRAAEIGEPQYSQRIQDDPRCTLKHCFEAEMCSFAALPLKGGDGVLGVLGLAFVEEYDFLERAAFLETLAALVATALENALLHDEMKLQSSSLEAQVFERTAELSHIADDLVESKERMRQLMAAVPDAIIIVDVETLCLTDVNGETTKLYGYSREELIGEGAFMLSADPEVSKAAMKEVLNGTYGSNNVNHHRRKDGTIFPVEISANTFTFGGRQMLCGAIRDVSRRTQAEEEVRRFRAAADVASYGVGMADIGGRLLYVNAAFAEMHGYTRDELRGRNLSIFHNDEQMERVGEINKQVFNEGSYVAEEVWHCKKDGSVFPTLMSGAVVRDDTGKPVVLSATAIDITERKEVEDDLRRFKTAAAKAAFGVGMADKSGKILYINDAFAEMCGYRPDELVGQHVSVLHTEEQMVRVSQLAERNIKEGGLIADEVMHLKKDGTVFPTLLSTTVIKNQSGEIDLFAITATDITKRKQDELKLVDFAETQAVLVREVNHRVKNNLAAIISLLHREEERIETEEMAPYKPLLREMVGRVRGLATVHSLLSESGWQPVLLSEIVGRVVRGALHAMPADAGIGVEVKESLVKVDADQAHHLALVLSELATNSAKYALAGRDSGQINVSIERRADDVLLSFSDDGPGFPDAVLAEKESLTGTGLELVEGIVTRTLRGEVALKNEDGAVVEILFPPQLGRREVRNAD